MKQSVSDNPKHLEAVSGSLGMTKAGGAVRAGLAVSYVRPGTISEPTAALAEIRFAQPRSAGAVAGTHSNGLRINVALLPLATAPATVFPVETWRAQGKVTTGEEGAVKYAHDGHHLFGIIEVDERSHGGILAAADFVYAEVRRFQSNSPYRHVLRMWNYADALNEGAGDMERYRQFCVGRARGLGDSFVESYPAASALGHQQVTHSLQVYWLAGRIPGHAVENPRQVSAYRYPSTYGPASPSFSRATIAPDNTLLISGTAAILGHASHHIGDAVAQLEETLRNLDALIAQAAGYRPGLQISLAPQTCLKVYVRSPALVATIDAHLRARFPEVTALYLAADICRRELLLEIECVQEA